MQMQGATELEQKIVAVVERCERELPASELETTIVATLGDAGRELQRLRGHWPKASKPDTGGPAFPCVPDAMPGNDGSWFQPSAYVDTPQGMTLRDWLAGMIGNGLVAAGGDYSRDDLAAESYRRADAFIQYRNVKL